eukprot:TRINITY_DN8361_c0_g1_i2.p1 TRINITY_DN8361_c0_g1~~TRINITY_DN8361_c0_g1_i2.p1  ORF type:complete len:176 (-),score=20.97 TRINITY_DN8361_c0_g1_i2:11-538(-)
MAWHFIDHHLAHRRAKVLGSVDTQAVPALTAAFGITVTDTFLDVLIITSCFCLIITAIAGRLLWCILRARSTALLGSGNAGGVPFHCAAVGISRAHTTSHRVDAAATSGLGKAAISKSLSASLGCVFGSVGGSGSDRGNCGGVGWGSSGIGGGVGGSTLKTVSYTHLTLPTICSV